MHYVVIRLSKNEPNWTHHHWQDATVVVYWASDEYNNYIFRAKVNILIYVST